MSNNTNPPQTDGLKACPFCCADAERMDGQFGRQIECTNCHAASAYASNATELWNTRLSLTPDKRDEEIADCAQFLCDRVRELEQVLKDDEVAREYAGHVLPALARMEAALTHTDKGE